MKAGYMRIVHLSVKDMLPLGVMLFSEPDQVLDLDNIASLGGDMSVIAP